MVRQQTLEKVTHDHVIFACKTVAPRGTLLSYSLTQEGFVEKISGNPDVVLTKAAGLLMEAVENGFGSPSNIDLGDDTGTISRARNHNRDVTYVSGVCRLLVHGYTETDQVDPASVFGQGSGLYIGANGLLTTTPLSVSGVGSAEKVGHALSSKRADGFVRVFINIK